jgi:membrane-bound lytic murein transglycosylase B
MYQMRQIVLLLLCACFVSILSLKEAEANPVPVSQWVTDFKQEAQSAGINAGLLNQAFRNFSPSERIIELDRKQPEGTISFQQYLRNVVNEARVGKGRVLMATHGALLNEIAAKYGVQPRFIVALWAIESNFGGNMGNFNVIHALATLAYDGRRSEFFRGELLKALQIIQDGHISFDAMKGSWAGAMGQCQFMPSSYQKFAIDYNQDGKRDIWSTHADVFASIANYLSQTGWDNTLTWGREVRVPATLDKRLVDSKIEKPMHFWNQQGVTRVDGSPLPNRELMASLVQPGGSGSYYLVYSNYKTILDWNRSLYFATSVGILADKLVGM